MIDIVSFLHRSSRRPAGGSKASSADNAEGNPPGVVRAGAALKKADREKAEILSFRTLFGYGVGQAGLGVVEMGSNVSFMMYTEVYDMRLGTQAMLRVLLKVIDVPFGFLIGYASDHTTSRWGRRLPYMAMAAPVAAVAIYLFSTPPPSLGDAGTAIQGTPSFGHSGDAEEDILEMKNEETEDHEEALVARLPANATLCADFVYAAWTGQCSLVAKCVATGIRLGQLEAWDAHKETIGEVMQVGVGAMAVNMWFFLTRFCMFSSGHTVIAVPYEALGMELTQNFDQRTRLFGYRGMLSVLAGIVSTVLSIVIARKFETDITLQARALGTYSAVVLSVCFVIVIATVQERNTVTRGTDVPPFVPTVHSMLINGPYRNYLIVRFFLAVGMDFMGATFGFLIKYGLQVENMFTVQVTTRATYAPNNTLV